MVRYCLAATAITLGVQRVFGTPVYNVEPLPTPTANVGADTQVSYSAVTRNSAGQIIFQADYSTSVGSSDPIVTSGTLAYQNGQFFTLPIPAGMGNSARAAAINNLGSVVGTTWMETNSSDSGPTYFPILWCNKVAAPLPLGDFAEAFPYAINCSGVVAGAAVINSTSQQENAVFWDNTGTMHDLGTFGGSSAAAVGINDHGQMLIEVSSSGGSANQVLLWDHGVTQAISGASGGGVAVNDLGHVIYTQVDDVGFPSSYFWNGSTSILLSPLAGDLGTSYVALNDGDQAVGISTDFGLSNHAVLWDNGTTYDLNTLIRPNAGWTLTSADAIASDGSILGEGIYQGQYEYFLLTPAGTGSSIPEPASLASLGLGAALMLRRRR